MGPSKLAHVLSDSIANYDVEKEEIDFSGIIQVEYACIELNADPLMLTAVVCEENDSIKEHFVSKCCPHGHILMRNLSACVESDMEWIQPRNILHHKTEMMTGAFQYNFDQRCNENETEVTLELYSVLTDGTFLPGETVPFLSRVEPYKCVDKVMDLDIQVAIICLKSDCTSDQCSLLKSHDITRERENGQESCLIPYLTTFRLVNTLSGLLSCVFLIITFLVYLFVPELNNLHGKIIISNVFAIFMVTSYLLFVYNFTNYLSTTMCIISGFIGYFFTISMFSWMTIMSFDLCWTFIRAQVPRKGSARLKLILYSITAWGFAGVLTLAIVILDQAIEDEDSNVIHELKPNVGKTKCFLHDSSLGLFLHLPIFSMMMLNGIFFMITTTTLYRSSSTTYQARHARRRSSVQAGMSISSVNHETRDQLVRNKSQM